ncbi:MAG: hypothetical protein Q8R92_08310 [Deltaproteobacteria bacterium]|nr:hypothetical protein [Deltaproteobacteria bacterium]
MSVIPCQRNKDLKKQIVELAEVFRTEAHTLGTHGLSERDFYQGGLFRGVIERLRGQFAATMNPKRDFVRLVLNHMQDRALIYNWESSGGANRHDYTVTLPDGRVCVIELKGCLDGNNTTIFERPAHAQEFILWSICENPGGDPRRNVWSGIHTRLSAEIIANEKQVDGLVVWDWLCGTVARPCPKLALREGRQTEVGPYLLTPPCIYLFPATIPSVRNNPNPEPHHLADVRFLAAIHQCFGGDDAEVNRVRFFVAHKGKELVRTTTVERGGVMQQRSTATPIRRR